MTKIAFLYSEIAGYFMACAEALAAHAEVLIVRWPTNSEAPFEFNGSNKLKIVVKSDFNTKELEELVNDFNPDILVCSGWMDKDYLNIIKKTPKKTKRVLSLDNHWNGNLKQQVAALISPFYLKKYFSHAWVPGSKQAKFAKKLGFGKHTLRGFYCADTPFFKGKYDATFTIKEKEFPKRFLYVARYVEHKGIFEMWEAFVQLQQEMNSDWELWCLGTGDEWDNRIQHDKIKHFGFVQPQDMDKYIEETGVYILPSKFEPWGVSVQEFAVAGFPLLLSKSIGSYEKFKGDNGWGFEAGNIADLKKEMKKVMQMNSSELINLGIKSHKIGMSYTTEQWAETILSIKNQ